MLKQQLIYQIKLLISQRMLTRDELQDLRSQIVGAQDQDEYAAASNHTPPPLQDIGPLQFDFSGTASYLGAIIFFLGLGILAYNYWGQMDSLTKIALTFGLGVSSYITANIFLTSRQFEITGGALHLLGGLMQAIGLFVFADQIGIAISPVINEIIFVSLFGLYFLTDLVHKKNVLSLFSIIYASLALVSTILLIGQLNFNVWYYYLPFWTLILISFSYIFLGQGLQNSRQAIMASPLIAFGGLIIVAVSVYLLYLEASFWQFITPVLLGFLFFLGNVLRRRSLLLSAILGILFYIYFITGKYFWQNFYWAGSVLGLGASLILAGAIIFQRNKQKIARMKPISEYAEPELPAQIGLFNDNFYKKD